MANYMSSKTISHFYSNIHGWFDFDNLYQDMIHTLCVENRQYMFAEIGCWKGKSTAFMAVEIANSSKNIDFYCIDTWKGSQEHINKDSAAFDKICLEENALYDMFLKNMEPVIHYIKPIRMPSVKASNTFEDGFFDFVFIDASHEYEDIKNDIQSWYPKVRSGGVLAGHDYGWGGVKKAVDEFVEKNNLTLNQSRSSWIIKR